MSLLLLLSDVVVSASASINEVNHVGPVGTEVSDRIGSVPGA